LSSAQRSVIVRLAIVGVRGPDGARAAVDVHAAVGVRDSASDDSRVPWDWYFMKGV
jgi:hypothetical protein